MSWVILVPQMMKQRLRFSDVADIKELNLNPSVVFTSKSNFMIVNI